MAKMSAGVIVIAFILIAILAVGAYSLYTLANKPAVTNPNPVTNPTGNTNNPSISFAVTDAVTNAAVTQAAVSYIVTKQDGTKFAATNTTYTGVSGDSVIAIDDPSGNYLADDVGPQGIVNGAQLLSFTPFAYANVSAVFKDDPISSSNTLSQGAGPSNNLSTVSNGSSRTIGMLLTGISQKSTGKQFWTLETPTSTGTNISSITVSCGGNVVNTVGLPACLSPANAGSKLVAFELPAQVGPTQVNCNVLIQAVATGSLGNGNYTFKEYAEQKYFASDNTLQEGICDTTPNGNNANKYQDSQSIIIKMGNA